MQCLPALALACLPRLRLGGLPAGSCRARKRWLPHEELKQLGVLASKARALGACLAALERVPAPASICTPRQRTGCLLGCGSDCFGRMGHVQWRGMTPSRCPRICCPYAYRVAALCRGRRCISTSCVLGQGFTSVSRVHREYTEEEDSTWITWFCNLKGNEFFAEVDEAFIQDDFNLVGLASQVPYYDYALDTILDIQTTGVLTEEQQQMVDSAAELLYGLIHQRFIITGRGLARMCEKFEDVDFGRCHRVLCEGQPMVPMGQADTPRRFTVSVFCPRCNDIYFPKSSRHSSVDGAFFGTTFPHLFFLTFPSLRPPPPESTYTPRVFGFRVYRGQLEGSAEAGEASNTKDGRPHSLAVRHLPAFPPEADAAAAAGGGEATPPSAAQVAWQQGYEAAKAELAAAGGTTPADAAAGGGGGVGVLPPPAHGPPTETVPVSPQVPGME